MNHIMRSSALMLLMLLASSVYAFDDPEIRVGISEDEIYVGESVTYSVEIRNSEEPSPPDMSALNELFDVVAAGDHANDQSSTIIINGRVSQSNFRSHIYQYRLTPKQSGDLQIPSPVATVDGKKLTGREIALRVIKPDKQDLVISELEVSPSKVYPTQPFNVTLRILVQPLPDNPDANPLRPLRREPPHLEVNWADPPEGLLASEKSDWLKPFLSRSAVGFTLNNFSSGGGFFNEAAVFDFSDGREMREDLKGDPVNYFKYELSRTFTAERYGQYKFGPALLKGTFVSGVSPEGYLARRIVLPSPAIEVEVREVPTPRPADFCGGIGKFSAVAKTNVTKLRVGDPLTLTLQVKLAAEGGSLELVSAPDLSLVEPLVADFELIEKNPTGRVEGLTKAFEYVMRPKRAAVSVPNLNFSTFDPVTEKFEEVSTSPIELEVNDSVGLNSGELIGAISSTNTSLKSLSEGIFQNITDPKVLRDERVPWRVWSQLVVGVWFLSGAFCAVVLLRRRKSNDTVGQRRQQAKRNANKRIAEARNASSRGETQHAMREVRSAVIGLVADCCNRVSEGLTTPDVDQLLATAKVADSERLTIKELLESIEAAEYGAGLAKDPRSTIEEASKWIARVAPQLDRRS